MIRAVATKSSFDFRFEKEVDLAADQVVAKVMERTLVLGVIVARKAVTDDHIVMVVQHEAGHLFEILKTICVIAIYHDVAERIDFAEHAPDDVALALHVLVTDDRAMFAGDFVRAIGGVVVVYVNRCLGAIFLCVIDDAGDRYGFVIARNEDSDGVHRCIL